METNILHQLLASRSPPSTIPPHNISSTLTPPIKTRFSLHRRGQSLRLNATSSDDTTPPPPPPQPPTITPPETVEIRFKRRSRKRARRQNDEDGIGVSQAVRPPQDSAPPKKWEDMSFSEKAIELYMGEKGLLFWLNKFAYASIFIVIGGWILFRFVGPSLNLYQLDTPPMSPSSIFKG